jgi:hypothetical protein
VVIISTIFSHAYALDMKLSGTNIKQADSMLKLSELNEKDLKILEELKENSVETNFNDEAIEKNVRESDKSLRSRVSIKRNLCKAKGGIVLQNGYVTTCVTPDGTFGAKYSQIGMTFNPNGNATTFQDDYLQPGTPWEYFSISVNNSLFTNNNYITSPSPSMPTTISSLGSVAGGVLAKSTIPAYPSLKIEQEYTLDPLSNSLKIRVVMTNKGEKTIKNIKYARGLDPDPDFIGFSRFETLNRRGYSFIKYPVTISPKDIAWSIGQKSHKMVSLYSVDPIKHNTCISPHWTVVPSNILANISPFCIQPTKNKKFGNNYSYGDYTINIAFDVGSLKPQEVKVILLKYIFDKPEKIMPLRYVIRPVRAVISYPSTLKK